MILDDYEKEIVDKANINLYNNSYEKDPYKKNATTCKLVYNLLKDLGLTKVAVSFDMCLKEY